MHTPFDALIVANGDIPPQALWPTMAYRTLICTDGAALTLKESGIYPHIIIGDMDSISSSSPIATPDTLQIQFPESQIHHLNEQDSTDFEKVLHYAHQQAFCHILCLGAMGKAVDHSIYNLCLLYRFSQKMQICLFHTYDNLSQWIFALKSYTQIQAHKDAIVSFFPLPEAKLLTKGLQWELNETTLNQLGSASVRNRMRTDNLKIMCEGACLCLITAKTPPSIQYK